MKPKTLSLIASASLLALIALCLAYQWSCMMILLYLTEGVIRTNDAAPGNALALAEAILSVIFFVATVLYARNTAPSRLAQASRDEA
jgi:uncharacterized membrane protein